VREQLHEGQRSGDTPPERRIGARARGREKCTPTPPPPCWMRAASPSVA
jgi:hypothetical protein